MAPQTEERLRRNMNVTPKYSHVHNNPQLSIVPGLQMESHVVLNMFNFYSQHYLFMRALYAELLLTGKDIFITEYKYASNYKMDIIFVPMCSERYFLKEIEVQFRHDIKPQFDKMVTKIIAILRIARQFNDSPFSQIL